jgi:thioredoxin 1
MIVASSDDFEKKVLGSTKPVVVMFYTTYCPHSRRLAPVFEQHNHDSRIAFAKIDITDDENPLWDRYNIEFVPTLIAFKGGQEVGRRGAHPGVGLSESDLLFLLEKL